MNLNVDSWKLFKISVLFDIDTGKDFIYSDAVGNDYNVIGHGKEDNGVACKSEFNSDYVLYDDNLTISMAHIGNYYATIQTDKFYLGTRTKGLKPKFIDDLKVLNLNYKEVYAFIVTVINFNSYKFCYGRVGSDKIANELILLPIIYENGKPKIDETKKYSDDGYIPDFKFMENYIKSLHHKPLTTTNKTPLPLRDTVKWEWFQLNKLFKIENCKCSNASDLEDGNDIYYIGAKKNENGIMKKVKKDVSLVTKGNCIIFICDGQGSVGFSNYMESDFIGSTTLSVGYNDNLNNYVGLFLVTVLDLERPKYSFGRKYRNSLNKVNIKLPIQIDKDGNSIKDDKDEFIPDWDYMENYIKSLPYGDRI